MTQETEELKIESVSQGINLKRGGAPNIEFTWCGVTAWNAEEP
jgi:hypothetical protein